MAQLQQVLLFKDSRIVTRLRLEQEALRAVVSRLLYLTGVQELQNFGPLSSRVKAATLDKIASMKEDDDFSCYYRQFLEGRYDCADRIVLNGYFPRGQSAGV